MDESTRVLEMVVSQLDKRMAFIEQNLVEIRRELGQIRAEISQIHMEIRNSMRRTVTTMIALFGVAVPVWMWVLGVVLKLR